MTSTSFVQGLYVFSRDNDFGHAWITQFYGEEIIKMVITVKDQECTHGVELSPQA